MEFDTTTQLDPEVLELEQVIQALDTLFEAGDPCIHPITNKVVTDPEYDRLRKKLSELHPESDIFSTPSASTLSSDAQVIKHHPPMTSISKAIGSIVERNADLDKFIASVQGELGYGVESLFAAYKRDGVAVSIEYDNEGRLKAAGLRPRDGVHGEDVTENIKMVKGVPTELWIHDKDGKRVKRLKAPLVIRGELECFISVFEERNKKYGGKYANPRNYTAGSIRQFKDPSITGERHISFVAYRILNYPDAPYKTEVDKAKWCNRVLRVPFVRTEKFDRTKLQQMEDYIPELDYEVDGVVIGVNNLEDSDQMGTHGNSPTGNPKGKLAWKFTEQEAQTTILRYTFTPGRTGRLTPVMEIDPVQLDGTTVSRVTGHSLGFMDGSSKSSPGELGVGTTIRVIKSGKIIPKCVGVVKAGKPFEAPDTCPSCSSKLVAEQGDDGKELICPNEYCGVRAVAALKHYLQIIGVKGIAGSTISKLQDADLVSQPGDFYRLNPRGLKEAGFTERQTVLTLARVWMIHDPEHKKDEDLKPLIKVARDAGISIPGWQVFASFGISSAGRSAGRALMAHFGSFDGILTASVDDLQAIGDIGDTTAQNIVAFFKKHGRMVRSVLKHVVPESPKQGKLSDKTFVFTGGFPNGKAHWEKAVTEEGGKTSGSVSKKSTDYLVVGTDAGSKHQKALGFGIICLTIDELKKML
jgi:DNA ligase (NAD+)